MTFSVLRIRKEGLLRVLANSLPAVLLTLTPSWGAELSSAEVSVQPQSIPFTSMIRVPTDPTTILYPDFYQDIAATDVELADPYCDVIAAEVHYPKHYLGRFLLPPISGAPLPDEIQRGVSLKDFWTDGMEDPSLNNCDSEDLHAAYIETLRRIQLLGADYISLVTYATLKDASAAVPQLDLLNPEIPNSEMAFITRQARQHGLKVFLHINIPSADMLGNALPQPPTREWYEAFLRSYATFIVQRARQAQRYGIEGLMLNNMDYEFDLTEYSDLLADRLSGALLKIRQVYDGKIILYDSWGLDVDRLQSVIPNVDYILFNLGQPWSMTKRENANLTTRMLVRKYNEQIDWIVSRYGPYQKPVMVRLFVQSHQNFLKNGWVEDAFCTDGCVQRRLKTDFSVQAIAFEAAFEALSQAHERGLTVHAIIPDAYWYTDTILPRKSFPNLSQTFRNKPAESIVYHWFSRQPGVQPGHSATSQ